MVRPTTTTRWKCLLWALLVTHDVTNVTALQPSPHVPGAAAGKVTAKAKAKSDLNLDLDLNLNLFPGAFDWNRMDALVQRGELEADMMRANLGPPLLAPVLLMLPTTTTTTTTTTPVVAVPVPSARASAGFGVGKVGGGSNNTKKGSKKTKAKAKAGQKNKKAPVEAQPEPVPLLLALSVKTLQQDGVVRLNNVMAASTAAILRKDALERRDAAFSAVQTGDDWRKHFADVLLKGSDSTRCDLLLPLTGNRAVQMALKELLLLADTTGGGVGKLSLGNMIQTAIGDDATLYELSVLISEPGSGRQPVHPDNPYQDQMPLTTCFVALQDISDNMGPTTFIPGSHTETAHAAFDTSVATRDTMLQRLPSTLALLQGGDAALFDSRTLHCAGANDGSTGSTRAVMCISFQNPRASKPIGNVGSIMPDIKQFTLKQLRQKLAMISEDDLTLDPFDDADGNGNDNDKEDVEQETIGVFRLAAAKGDADAMFNLGLCYKNGEQGVEKDAATAFSWFQRAAVAVAVAETSGGGGDERGRGRGHATAQCNLAVCYYTGEGVSQDNVEAARWFELAAAQGLAAAQHNLGFCYATGTGVAMDNAKAAVLFKQAAAQGHAGAQEFYEEVTKKQSL